MAKFIECIKAYVYNTTYAGTASGMGHSVYNVSENIDLAELGAINAAMSVQRTFPQLDSLDAERGVVMSGTATVPDPSAVSFSYSPSAKEGAPRVLVRSCMRASLADHVMLRGTKELDHAVLVYDMNEDDYAVDYLSSAVFGANNDIAGEVVKAEMSRGATVKEEQPERLPAITESEFVSRPITASELGSDEERRAAARILDAVLSVKREEKVGRTAFIVYAPEERERVCKLIFAALKLLPPALANQVSFMTCAGSLAAAGGTDLVGIPATDDALVYGLGMRGTVVDLRPTASEEKFVTRYAKFIADADYTILEAWFTDRGRYFGTVTKFGSPDRLIAYFEHLYPKTSVSHPKEFSDELAEHAALVDKDFGVVCQVEGEVFNQLDSLARRTEELLPLLTVCEKRTVQGIFMSLGSIAEKYLKEFGEPHDGIVDALYGIVFGGASDGEELRKWHFDFLSTPTVRAFETLENCGDKIESYVAKHWTSGGFDAFFSDYLASERYMHIADKQVFYILQKYLGDLRDPATAAAREGLAAKFLAVNTDRFSEFAAAALNGRNDVEDACAFLIASMPRAGKNASRQEQEVYLKAADAFAAEVTAREACKRAISFVCGEMMPSGSLNNDPVILSALLAHYAPVPEFKADFDILADKHEQVKAVIGDYAADPYISSCAFGYVMDKIIAPGYPEAVRRVDLSRYTEAWRESMLAFAADYDGKPYGGEEGAKFVAAVRDLVARYDVFKKQESREKVLRDFRTEFVVRELLLLGRRTVRSIFTEHFGKKKTAKIFAPLKGVPRKERHAKFTELAEAAAEQYLNADYVPAEKKRKFASDVRDVKDKRTLQSYGTLAMDASGGVIASILVFVGFFALSFVLGGLIRTYVDEGYFRAAYIALSFVVAGAGVVLYWYNYGDRRKRAALLTTVWQTVLVMVVLMGCFVLVRFLTGTLL